MDALTVSLPAAAEAAGEPRRTYPRRGVHGRLVETIGRRIVAEGLESGSALPREVELMDEFGASRTAVREAIKVLAAKGLVEPRRRRGMLVRAQDEWNLLDPDVLAWCAADGPSPRLLEQMVELRRMIEPAAARLAAVRRSEAELAALTAAYDAMRRATRDLEAYYRADLAFHRTIFRAAGNPFVDRLGTIVSVILDVSFGLQQRSPMPAECGLVLHRPVLDAIRERDAATAETAMLRIIEAARFELTQASEDDVQRQP